MKSDAVNRNLLAAADAPYMALLGLGYEPHEIQQAWESHQKALRKQGREPRYFTALWKFLGADGPESGQAKGMIDSCRARRAKAEAAKTADLRERAARELEKQAENALQASPEYRTLSRQRSDLFRRSLTDPAAKTKFFEVNEAIEKLKRTACLSLRAEKGATCHA